jgi:trigger factor
MATAVRTQIDNTNSIFEITIEKADYLPIFEKEIKKYKQKAQLKGFRPGTAPMSMIKKMYGQPIMYETIMEKVNSTLFEGLDAENLNPLGQPELVITEDDKQVISVMNPLDEYRFSFQVGHYNLDLKGLDQTTVINHYKVADLTKEAESNFERFVQKAVRPEDHLDVIEEGDIFYIESKELDADGNVKEGGYETTFNVYSKSMRMRQAAKDLFFDKLKVGDEVTFNARDLDEFETANSIKEVETNYRRYILNLETSDDREVGNFFTGKITSVLRTAPPVMDESFFNDNFGPEVGTKEQALDAIKEMLEHQYDEVSQIYLRRQAKLALIEQNQFELPTLMLKKYLLSNDKDMDNEKFDTNAPALMNQVRYQIISDTIAADLDIEITKDELEAYCYEVIQNQYRINLPAQYLQPMVKRMLSDKDAMERAHQVIKVQKVLDYAVRQMKSEIVTVTDEELIKRTEADLAKEKALLATTLEDEEEGE